MAKQFYYVPVPAPTFAAWICGKCGIGNKQGVSDCIRCGTMKTTFGD